MPAEKTENFPNNLKTIEIFSKDILRMKDARADKNDFLIHEARSILDENISLIKRNWHSVLELSRYDESLENTVNAYDLVKSTLAMHWVNDVLGLMNKIKIALVPDGLFIANFFGGECLKELKFAFAQADKNSISPRVSPYITAETAGFLLQSAGFALPVVAQEKIEVSYENAYALMRHLRKIGETNSITKQRKNFTGKKFMSRVNEIYAENFSDAEGRITATFEIITMVGWKPDDNQQQPLKRGSAEKSLKDVL